MTLGSLAFWVAAAAVSAGAARAVRPADGDARILVVPSDAARAEELYAGLRAAGLLPVGVEERAGVDLPALEESEPGTRDGARAKLQEARALLRELDAAGARAAVDAAVDEVIRLDQPQDAVELLVDALLVRATLALIEGRVDDVRADLLLTSRLEPARTELHPGLYPPSLVEAYAAARAVDAEERARATLVVRPRAAGFAPTRVLVDARAWDGAPLAPGPHLLVVQGDGVVPRSEVRDLDAAAPTLLEPFLAPAGAGAARAALVTAARAARTDAEVAAALAALGDAAAARVVVLELPARLVLFVAGQPVTSLVPPARDGVTVGRVVLAALQPARSGAGTAPPPARDDEGPSPALVWGAVTVSAAVVVLGSGAAVLTWALWPPDDIAPPPRPVPVGCCTD